MGAGGAGGWVEVLVLTSSSCSSTLLVPVAGPLPSRYCLPLLVSTQSLSMSRHSQLCDATVGVGKTAVLINIVQEVGARHGAEPSVTSVMLASQTVTVTH